MPLVEEQVEHLARPIRSIVSHKEKKSLTSKVKANIVDIDRIMDSGPSRTDTVGVAGVTGGFR